ncbi:MAG: hypothetical protein WAM66_09555 [Acidobacteriaceae bacterium]
MKVLALVLIAYTAVMLLIHVTSGKLFKLWNGPGDSWVKRWFSAQVALRVEALYWLLVLASWPFWPSGGWKTVVVVFAVIHLGAWLAGERQVLRSGAPSALPPKARRFVVAFDLVEAVALVAIAWLTVLHLLHGGRPFSGA